MRHTHIKNIVLLSVSVLALSACGTTSGTDSASLDRTAKIDNVLERAAREASRGGHTEQSLGIMENRYKRNSNDPAIATEYARALREMDYLNRASIVLSPFARDPDGSLAAKNEFAAIQLALGNYVMAEDFAKQVIIADQQNAQAFQYLGIALDAQGMYEEAERAYRKGLDTWEGDPTSIMNNLALNLATQGYIDEAVEILEKAQSIAPDRVEVERNLRIVRTLQETTHWSQKKTKEKSINVVPKKKPAQDS